MLILSISVTFDVTCLTVTSHTPMHVLITHLTLLGALVVTNAILRRLTNRRFIIIIIIIIIIICNYEIMQATLANTFLFILQDY